MDVKVMESKVALYPDTRKVIMQVETAQNILSKKTDTVLVTTQNFDAGEVIFNFDRELIEGEALDVKIYLPKKLIDCRARVKNIKPTETAPLVSVCAHFEGLSQNDKDYIEKFIH